MAISLLYGFAYRIVDINDFLLNFTGVLLGYGILNGAAFLYCSVAGESPRVGDPRDGGLWGHIESVLNALARP